tara:strand:- start:248 stop:1579 length:1332 start_codon:yes stop_codon:yes gene_type:complete
MKKKILIIILPLIFILSLLLFKSEISYNTKTMHFLRNNVPDNLLSKLRQVYIFYNYKLRKSYVLKKNINNQKIKISNKQFILNGYSNNQLKLNGPKNYLEIFENKLFTITGNGILSFINLDDLNEDQLKLNIIRTNINKVLGYKYIADNSRFILDLFIKNDEVFISYVNEIKKDCFNTSIMKGKLNLKKINFNEYFVSKECIDTANDYNEFKLGQSGGAISDFKNDDILIAIGEFGFRDKAQDKNNIFGKILRITKEGKYEILSMGHRNPQGLFYNKIDNIILSSEHGPQGGDEINLNRLSDIKIKNFGWPIASYGEHYGGKIEENNELYLKAPLLKSHRDNGFVEPFKSFVPSIAPTKVLIINANTSINKKKYVFLSSLGFDLEEGDMSIHRFLINESYEILEHDIIPINSRIRDMIFSEKLNKIILFLEKYGSIATLKIIE